MTLIVDSHCHLNFPQFAGQLDDVVKRAGEMSVGVMQTICTKISEFDEVHEIAKSYDNIYCSVGVHPHEAGKSTVVSVDELLELSKNPKVIGLGETGLDYYYEHSSRESQKESFINHIEASRKSGLPVIVHTRDADDDTIEILSSEMKKGEFPFLIHCFSSSLWLAEESIKLGGYISISGIVTFKKSDELRAVVAKLPLDRLLVETDSPYLAPAPNRGKANEPGWTRYVCEEVAKVKGLSLEECAKATTDNFFRLFGKASP